MFDFPYSKISINKIILFISHFAVFHEYLKMKHLVLKMFFNCDSISQDKLWDRLVVMPINHQAHLPSYLSASCLTLFILISHHAYLPSYLSSIKPISHYAQSTTLRPKTSRTCGGGQWQYSNADHIASIDIGLVQWNLFQFSNDAYKSASD